MNAKKIDNEIDCSVRKACRTIIEAVEKWPSYDPIDLVRSISDETYRKIFSSKKFMTIYHKDDTIMKIKYQKDGWFFTKVSSKLAKNVKSSSSLSYLINIKFIDLNSNISLIRKIKKLAE